MCPACFAITALLITGVASTGGDNNAITARLLRKKKAVKFLSFPTKGKTRNERAERRLRRPQVKRLLEI